MPPSGHLMRHRKTKYTKGPDRLSTIEAIYHIFLRLSIHYFCIYANFFTSLCMFFHFFPLSPLFRLFFSIAYLTFARPPQGCPPCKEPLMRVKLPDNSLRFCRFSQLPHFSNLLTSCPSRPYFGFFFQAEYDSVFFKDVCIF